MKISSLRRVFFPQNVEKRKPWVKQTKKIKKIFQKITKFDIKELFKVNKSIHYCEIQTKRHDVLT